MNKFQLFAIALLVSAVSLAQPGFDNDVNDAAPISDYILPALAVAVIIAAYKFFASAKTA